jgi:hypothetical protein
MSWPKELRARLPPLDGRTAFELIGLLDALVVELWLLYGDEIASDSARAIDGRDVDPSDDDLPF